MRFLFRNFRFIYRLDRWVRRHFTAAGFLVIGGMVAAGIFGVDTRQSTAYQVFAFLSALLVIAVAAGRPRGARFRMRRELPEFVTAGEPTEYLVSVENLGRRAQPEFLLRERLEETLPSYEEFVSARVPGDAERNWFDRRIGYPRWLWLIHRRRGANIEESVVPPLPPGGKARVRVRLQPLRRGVLCFRETSLAQPDPLGIYLGSLSVSDPASLIVLPKRYPLPPIDLPGARRYHRGGLALASRVGDAEEFIGLRDYRPGDALRRIHWRSFARAGRPIVKEYQDEFFVRHALVLDTFPGDADDERFEAAVSVAASFACAVRTRESLLDLMFVGAEAYCFTAGRGLASADAMLRMLAAVAPCRDKQFGALTQAVTARAGILSGCICIFLDWGEARRELVRRLQALGVPLLVIVIGADGARFDPEPMVGDPRNFRLLRADRLEEDMRTL
ncbi:MAG: DUF58 domain-containing protein [Betaproteobacteria bacterium]|nr:DUF58 domain-containing protein [Betaproteobacteria bacterium]